jgi:branched-chain amino acid transport system substrate-binding protein
MAKFAREKLGAKRVALLTEVTNAYSVGLAKFFRERFVADGGTIVVEQKYSAAERDFKAQLTAIKSAGIDAIFVPGYYTEAGLIVVQARELGLQVPVLGGDGWSAPQLAEIGGAALKDTYYCDNFSVEAKLPEATRFIAHFKERYGAEPDAIASVAYDAVGMLADAIKRAGAAEPAKIRDALATIKDLPGVSGKITIDEHRDPVKPAYVLGFKQGTYGLIEAIYP